MTRQIKIIQMAIARLVTLFVTNIDGSQSRRRHLKQRAITAMMQTTGHRMVRAHHIQQLRGQA